MKRLQSYLLTVYFISVVIVGAASDGLWLQGHKEWGHTLEALELFMLLVGPLLYAAKNPVWFGTILAYLGAYIAFRFAFFDIMHNLAAGLEWDHMGTRSFYDDILSKVPGHGLLFARVVFLMLGIGVTFKEL